MSSDAIDRPEHELRREAQQYLQLASDPEWPRQVRAEASERSVELFVAADEAGENA